MFTLPFFTLFYYLQNFALFWLSVRSIIYTNNHFQDCRMFAEINKKKHFRRKMCIAHTHWMRCIIHNQRLVLLFNSHKSSSLFYRIFPTALFFLFAVGRIWMEVKATANRNSLSYSKNFSLFFPFSSGIYRCFLCAKHGKQTAWYEYHTYSQWKICILYILSPIHFNLLIIVRLLRKYSIIEG